MPTQNLQDFSVAIYFRNVHGCQPYVAALSHISPGRHQLPQNPRVADRCSKVCWCRAVSVCSIDISPGRNERL